MNDKGIDVQEQLVFSRDLYNMEALSLRPFLRRIYSNFSTAAVAIIALVLSLLSLEALCEREKAASLTVSS